jgi:HEPN domain-containing protein
MNAEARKPIDLVRLRPLLFHRYADEFRLAGLDMKSDFTPVQCFLYCRSIELSLKAFLLTKGVTVSKLRDRKKGIGHDLEAALREAESRGLSDFIEIRGESREELRKANDYYLAKGLEYADDEEVMMKYHLPDPKVLYKFALGLVYVFVEFWSESMQGLVQKSGVGKFEI